jgi:fumarylacetoacetase
VKSSWIPGADGSDFSSATLPLGLARLAHDTEPRLVTRVGDQVLDLHALAEGGELSPALSARVLNPLLASGRGQWVEMRARLTELVTDPTHRTVVTPHLVDLPDAELLLPFDVADYVDFYSSEQHARNVSAIFRPDSPHLPENWKYVPIGYHGRAGTVVVSGTPVRRPRGQQRPRGASDPSFGPSRRLDIEAEVGFVVGAPSQIGSSVSAVDFSDHVFGVVLVNDWSARDIQAWEYVPLGPFLGKSFATSVSPWVVPLDALQSARRPLGTQDPAVFEYLDDPEPWCLDLRLTVRLNGTVVSEPPFATQYWSPGQQLAHLTVNGASLRTGDLYASGTVTGPERHQRGSFLELSWGGAEPFALDDGSTRTFLEDGDTVSISAWAPGPEGTRIGFGEVVGTVTPAVTTGEE